MTASGVMNRKSLDAPEETISRNGNRRNRMRLIRSGAFISVLFFTVFFAGLYLGRQKIIPFVYTRSEYMIGIYTGSSPLELEPAGGFNPVVTARMVTDVEAEFVADPFMIKENGIWYMFFEILEGTQNKGIIGLATSADGLNWEYDRVVLEQPFHLSYPHVFRHNGEILMIPESHKNYTVDIYRAENFPYNWKRQHTLVEGNYLDPTVFQYGDHWYMFAADRDDMLHLFWADDLYGEWHYHPLSPIVKGDLLQARPAGRVLVIGDTVIRFAQNCKPQYGWDVRAFLISELSPETYEEKPFSGNPVLKGTGTVYEWNGIRMHHFDATRTEEGWIAVVDGVGRWREFGLGFFGREPKAALGPTIPIKSPYRNRSK